MPKHAAVKPAVPVEHKVIQPAAASAALGVVIAILNALSGGDVLDSLGVPAQFQPIILVVIPPLVTLLTGYLAPHTQRPDLEQPPGEAKAVTVTAHGVTLADTRTPAEPEPPACGH